MKFLVLFIAVLLQQQVPAASRLNQRLGFDRFIGLFERWSGFQRLGAVAQFALVVVIPTILVGALFWWLDSVAWGLPALLAEIVLLLLLLAQANIGRPLRHYRECLANGDLEAAYLCARQTITVPGLEATSDAETMNQQVLKAVVYRWFEFFFLMVFWYVLADVAGVVLAWLTLNLARYQQNLPQFRCMGDAVADSATDQSQNTVSNCAVAKPVDADVVSVDQAELEQDKQERGESEKDEPDAKEPENNASASPETETVSNREGVSSRLATTCLYWLEWAPARLLGLTYCLAGNMMMALPVWRSLLWNTGASSQNVLGDVARAALGKQAQGSSWHDFSDDAEAASAELDEWHQLHLRSESVWLVMIAVATIGGWLI
ncbi:regulatory signaling modulator protein AmpE [Oceanobacter kriegii]|uniref:regulatory signaling modulator protein AmpE n=1 Tax=Oceanobacter kriegii TaxID=64972 RepID=UPI000404697D|nr:regulatory signaling modulator protein AmpE [Oceanobacter kriegii]